MYDELMTPMHCIKDGLGSEEEGMQITVRIRRKKEEGPVTVVAVQAERKQEVREETAKKKARDEVDEVMAKAKEEVVAEAEAKVIVITVQ